MKKLSCIALLAGTIFFCSCGNGANEKKDTDTIASSKDGEVMVSQPDTSVKAGVPTVDEKCIEFATKAANAGMKEIELAQWQQSYGTRQDVKDFAATMIADHTKASDELKTIAVSKNVVLPVSLPESERDDINKMKMKKQGKEIDKAYVDEMVKDHKDAVKLFEDAAKNATDADLKNFAAKTLPALQHHYDMIKAIKAKM